MIVKKILWVIGGILLASIIVIGVSMGSSLINFLTFKVLPQSNDSIIYFSGYGGNSGLIIGEDAALLVDTKLGKGSKKLYNFTQEKIVDKKLYIVNTHFHADHNSGNKLYEKTEIISGNYGIDYWLSLNKQENLPTRWIDSTLTLDLGGIEAEIIPIGQNHTSDDLFIYIPKEKVLFAGDLYTHQSHPVMKEDSNPDIIKWENTLRSYYASTLDIELVIPGHGYLAEKSDLISIADYFTDFKSTSKKELKKKYGDWEKLPFLATINQSWNYIRKQGSNP